MSTYLRVSATAPCMSGSRRILCKESGSIITTSWRALQSVTVYTCSSGIEVHELMDSAIAREKAIKEWKRTWKLELIEKSKPTWRELYDEIV